MCKTEVWVGNAWQGCKNNCPACENKQHRAQPAHMRNYDNLIVVLHGEKLVFPGWIDVRRNIAGGGIEIVKDTSYSGRLFFEGKDVGSYVYTNNFSLPEPELDQEGVED